MDCKNLRQNLTLMADACSALSTALGGTKAKAEAEELKRRLDGLVNKVVDVIEMAVKTCHDDHDGMVTAELAAELVSLEEVIKGLETTSVGEG